MNPSAHPQYSAPAKLAHWLTLLLLIGSFSVGYYMVDLKFSPTKLQLYSYHKWIGVTVFGLVVLRSLWRLTHRPPELPTHMADWEKSVANYTHYFLYLLLFAVPLSGWLMSSALGYQTVYLGKLPIPDLLAKNIPLGQTLQDVHGDLTTLLLIVVGAHAAAALKHFFIDRDDVLQRMLPSFGRQ